MFTNDLLSTTFHWDTMLGSVSDLKKKGADLDVGIKWFTSGRV